MKHRLSCHAFVAALLALTATASLARSCDEVISSIDARLKARGISAYTLEAVPLDNVKGQRVVGSCDAGTQKIIYAHSPATATPVAGTTVAQFHSPGATPSPAAPSSLAASTAPVSTSSQ